jgi:protein TonB
MDQGPQVNAPQAGASREALEDLVYGASLGDRAVRRASPWVTVPVTLVLAGALGVVAFALARPDETDKPEPRTVDVVLQEGPDGHVAAPVPARVAAAPAAPSPAPAPAPAPMREAAPPPEPRAETAPEATPRELPKEDLSRQYGGHAGGDGAGAGLGSGGGGGTGGPGAGGIGTGTGGGPARIMDVEFTKIQVKFQPPKPPYPPLARSARIQGTVVVQVSVGIDGVPISAHALQGPFQLRATAEAYALAWRFFPPLLNGVPQPCRFTLNMPFNLI